MLIVRITDEFNTTWESVCNTDVQAVALVSEWLANRNETPIYEIHIEIDPLESKE